MSFSTANFRKPGFMPGFFVGYLNHALRQAPAARYSACGQKMLYNIFKTFHTSAR
jgi:hypothetical protein